jgi:hypothetical protein
MSPSIRTRSRSPFWIPAVILLAASCDENSNPPPNLYDLRTKDGAGEAVLDVGTTFDIPISSPDSTVPVDQPVAKSEMGVDGLAKSEATVKSDGAGKTEASAKIDSSSKSDKSAAKPDLYMVGDAGIKQICTAINSAFLLMIPQAKTCSTVIPTIQCTLKTKTRLDCPCNTYINQNNTTEVTTLSALENQWSSLKCSNLSWVCPATPCAQPKGATCTKASSGSDSCIDY